MEAVKQAIKITLPDISHADMIQLLSRFSELGVERIEHLRYVNETDLVGCLKPVPLRLLISTLHSRHKPLSLPKGACKYQTITPFDTGQPAITEFLEFSNRISRLMPLLSDRMDPDCGLLDHMVSDGIITPSDASDVRADVTLSSRNRVLLDHVIKTCNDVTKQRAFLTSLEKSRQSHIANYIDSNGVIDKSKHGEVRPLAEKHLHRLAVNHVMLVDTIDLSGPLMSMLESKRCLTWKQRERLTRPGLTDFERNQELLDMIRRSSVANYKQFITCLRLSGQPHVANIISSCDKPGVLISADVKLTQLGDSHTQSLTINENRIVKRLRETIVQLSNGDVTNDDDNETLEDVKTELTRLHLNGIDIISAQTQNSIGLKFFCRSPKSAQLFGRRLKSGRLKRTIESLFNQLLRLSADGKQIVRIIVEDIIISNEEVIQNMTSENAVGGVKMNERLSEQLPYEMMELVLLSAMVVFSRVRYKVDAVGHKHVFITMASVCEEWHEVITCSRWFRRRLRRNIASPLRPMRRQPLYLTTLSSELRAVWGVAWLVDRIFVACSKSNSLMVYEGDHPFRCVDEVVVTGLGDFWDIVACSTNSCLYITDFTNKCVWLVTYPEQTITKWLEGVGWPWTVSLVKEGHVIMVNSQPPHIDIYSTHAEKLKSIPLPGDVTNPLHAVELVMTSPNVTHYVVSHGRNDNDLHRVCIVSSEGVLLHSYGSHPGDVIGMLNGPGYLLVIRTDDVTGIRILVAEYHNARVALFDTKLTLLRIVVAASGAVDQLIERPRRICYVADKGILLVGLAGQRGVEVWRLVNTSRLNAAACDGKSEEGSSNQIDKDSLVLEQQRLLMQLQTNDKKMSRVLQIARVLGQENLPLSSHKESMDKSWPADSRRDIARNHLQ